MEGAYRVEMDPSKAQELVRYGASLLLLDVPPSTLFGIDLKIFSTGPNFKGVKMIPPGPHFVYYSSTSRHGSDSSPITGFFIYALPSQVFVRRWDLQKECLLKLTDVDEEERFVIAVKNFEFDQELGPYDVHHFRMWQNLSNHITSEIIDKLEPLGKDISIAAEGELVEQNSQTMAEKQLMEQISNFEQIHSRKFAVQRDPSSTSHDTQEKRAFGSEDIKSSSGGCFYTTIPRLVHQPGTPAKELTALNVDKSTMLEMVLERHFNVSEDAFMGEFQFCFIAFLMGQSLESFRQWKAFVSLLFGCEEAPLRTRTKLFVKFLRVLYFQLKQSLSPELVTHEQYEQPQQPLLDASWFTDDNFLRLLCKEFFLMVKTSQPIDGDLLLQSRKLEKLLESCLGWNFNDSSYFGEEDEYAPTIVSDGEV